MASKTFICKECTKSYSRKENLDLHMRLHRSDYIKHEFSCDLCQYKTVRSQSMKNHLNVHSRKCVSCGVCGNTFATENRLFIHQKRIHTVNILDFNCDSCGMIFLKKNNLSMHLKIHDQDKPLKYNCDECDYKTWRSGEYKIHKSTHQNLEKKHTCKQCGYKTWSMKYLKSHIKRHEIGSVTCNLCQKVLSSMNTLHTHKQRIHLNHNSEEHFCTLCPKSYKLKSTLTNHISWVHGNKELNCSICYKKFKSKLSLNRHAKLHKEVTAEFKCEYCGKSFINRTKLSRHLQIHINPDEKKFSCDICSAAFREKYNLKEHVKNIHCSEVTVPIHSCLECNKEFKRKGTLRIHVRDVHSDQKFICPICANEFSSTRSLKQHKDKQHGKPNDKEKLNKKRRGRESQKVKCDQCGDYVRKSYLDNHQKAKHEKGEKVQCTICDYQSVYKSFIKVHIKEVHEKKIKHHCDECGKSFVRKTSYNKHQLTHTDIKFPCQLCDFKTRYKSYIKRHINDVHTKEQARINI